MDTLYKLMYKLKVYTEGITCDGCVSIDNIKWAMGHADNFLGEPKGQFSAYHFSHLDVVKSAMVKPDYFEFLTTEQKILFAKKALSYLKKDLIFYSRKHREYMSEENKVNKAKDIVEKFLKKGINTIFTGDANDLVLQRVLGVRTTHTYKLKVNSKVSLYADTTVTTKNSSCGRYIFYSSKASGSICVDDVTHQYKDLAIDEWGWDNYPSS